MYHRFEFVGELGDRINSSTLGVAAQRVWCQLCWWLWSVELRLGSDEIRSHTHTTKFDYPSQFSVNAQRIGSSQCTAKSQSAIFNSLTQQVISYKLNKLDGECRSGGRLMTYLSRHNHHRGVCQLCLFEWQMESAARWTTSHSSAPRTSELFPEDTCFYVRHVINNS